LYDQFRQNSSENYQTLRCTFRDSLCPEEESGFPNLNETFANIAYEEFGRTMLRQVQKQLPNISQSIILQLRENVTNFQMKLKQESVPSIQSIVQDVGTIERIVQQRSLELRTRLQEATLNTLRGAYAFCAQQTGKGTKDSMLTRIKSEMLVLSGALVNATHRLIKQMQTDITSHLESLE
jgi:hypothetical protein